MSTGLAKGSLVEVLQAKHPARTEAPGPRRVDHPVLRLLPEWLETALGSGMPRWSGTGVDGWRFEHFRDLCAESPEARAAVLRLLQRIAETRVPSRVAKFLRVLILLAFGKDAKSDGSPDARPIGVASVVRRLLGRTVIIGHRDYIARILAPFQFACGVLSGADMMCHTMRVMLDMHPDWIWFAWDLANAFNSVSREAVFRALEADPELRCLVPLYCMLHDAAGDLLYRDERGLHTISSQDGVIQGCSLAMALFCVAIAPVIKRIATLYPEDSGVVVFADDGRVGAPAATLRRILDAATEEFRGVGLSL